MGGVWRKDEKREEAVIHRDPDKQVWSLVCFPILSRNETVLLVTKMLYFNFCRGFINPKLFEFSQVRLLQARKKEPALPGVVQRSFAGFILSRASTAPEGAWLCAGLGRGIRRARPETGLLAHTYIYTSR